MSLTELFQAVVQNNLYIVNELLEKGTDVNSLGKDGSTALHYAAKLGHLELTELLLKFNAIIDALDKNKKTPLIIAVSNGHTRISKVLLSNGAKINGKCDSLSPLHYAAYSGQKETTTLLLESGAKTNISRGRDGTALHLVCKKQYYEIVEVLLSNGCSVNSLNNIKETPLHLAVQCNNKAAWKKHYICDLLLKNGSDIESRNYELETPLHSACKVSGNEDIIQLLLNFGANVNVLNDQNETPIFHTISLFSVCAYESVKILLNANAYPDIINKDGMSPLILAIKKENLKIIRTLLKYSADIDIQNQYGETALHIACKGKNKNIVKLLLSYGASINIKNFWNETPVMIAFLRSTLIIQCIISDHIIMLNCANLYVSKENFEFTKMISNDTWSMLNHAMLSNNKFYLKKKCNKELTVMKCQKISGTNLNVFNILIGNIDQLAKYARNNRILEFFKLNSGVQFPVYSDFVKNNLKKGLRRYNLLILSNDALCKTSNHFFQLPYTCVENILNYLHDRDLITVIDTCKPAIKKV